MVVYEPPRYVNLTNGDSNQRPKWVHAGTMDLEFQAIGYFINPEFWAAVPFNDSSNMMDVAAVTLRFDTQQVWQTQPPVANRQAAPSDLFMSFHRNPFHWLRLYDQNAAQNIWAYQFQNVLNTVLKPSDDTGVLHLTRGVSLSDVYSPHGNFYICLKEKLASRRGIWIDKMPGQTTETQTVVVVEAETGIWCDGTIFTFWSHDEGQITELISLDVGGLSSFTMNFNLAADAAPVEVTPDEYDMPAYSDFNYFSLYPCANVQDFGVFVTASGGGSVLRQIMAPSMDWIPTISDEYREVSNLLRTQFNGNQTGGPQTGILTTAAGNAGVRWNVNAWDWLDIFYAGQGQGSQYNECISSDETRANRIYDQPNANGFSTHLTVRNKNDLDLKRAWDRNPKLNTLTDEWIDEMDLISQDSKTAVITTPNNVNADGSPVNTTPNGANFKIYAYKGLEYTSGKQGIMEETPCDELVNAWKKVKMQRKHVPFCVPGFYNHGHMMTNYFYEGGVGGDHYDSAWGNKVPNWPSMTEAIEAGGA